jgi:hypothetical protein
LALASLVGAATYPATPTAFASQVLTPVNLRFPSASELTVILPAPSNLNLV